MFSPDVQEKYRSISTNRNVVKMRQMERISYINGVFGIAGLKDYTHYNNQRKYLSELASTRNVMATLSRENPSNLTLEQVTDAPIFKAFAFPATLKNISGSENLHAVYIALENQIEKVRMELDRYNDTPAARTVIEEIDYLQLLADGLRKEELSRLDALKN